MSKSLKSFGLPSKKRFLGNKDESDGRVTARTSSLPPPGVPTSVIRSPLTLSSPELSSNKKPADKPEVETVPRPLTNNVLKSINFVPGGARGVYVLTMNAPFTFLRGAPEKFSTFGAPVKLTDEPNFCQSMVCFFLLTSHLTII